ncbi:MAG: acyl-CoA thioesterase [Novosphingobium sp.]
MSQATDALATLARDTLNLERVGDLLFRSALARDNSQGTVFGGQFLAQALHSARRTVPDWAAHSCSAYFLRPGKTGTPIDYHVEVVRDGRNFANRRVVARQDGKALFDMLCAFHAPGQGVSHEVSPPPDIPAPEGLPDIQDWLRAQADRIPLEEVESYFQPLPVQFRLLDAERVYHLEGEPEPRRGYWMRIPSAAGVADIADHLPLVAMASDFFVGPVATAPFSPPYPRRLPVSTVSHQMTFHAPARAEQWLLYLVESPWAGEGLGLTRGMLFDRAGALVATVVQEVVIFS